MYIYRVYLLLTYYRTKKDPNLGGSLRFSEGTMDLWNATRFACELVKAAERRHVPRAWPQNELTSCAVCGTCAHNM